MTWAKLYAAFPAWIINEAKRITKLWKLYWTGVSALLINKSVVRQLKLKPNASAIKWTVTNRVDLTLGPNVVSIFSKLLVSGSSSGFQLSSCFWPEFCIFSLWQTIWCFSSIWFQSPNATECPVAKITKQMQKSHQERGGRQPTGDCCALLLLGPLLGPKEFQEKESAISHCIAC